MCSDEVKQRTIIKYKFYTKSILQTYTEPLHINM